MNHMEAMSLFLQTMQAAKAAGTIKSVDKTVASRHAELMAAAKMTYEKLHSTKG